MRASYDAVVIGSGFGGAVAACRLAQAGFSVGLLERGRRYGRGEFPRDFDKLDGWLWGNDHGLVDLKPFHQMQIVQAAGYGGGSLIYANVHLRPPPEVFAGGWPAGYSRATLDPYYDLAAYMLDITPVPENELPAKTRTLRQVAASLGRADQFCLPNLAVSFGAPGVERTNKFGAQQTGCNHCGGCIIGCNDHAKNTLDLNYLKLAEAYLADVTTQCEVWSIAPNDGGGYRVHFRSWGPGGVQEGYTDAQRVFVCAGAVSSTELLLRCRDQWGTLPKISAQLGEKYSGNGDLLAFAFDAKLPFDSCQGPTITTGLVYDKESWFILQDGGFPDGFSNLVRLLDRTGHRGAQTYGPGTAVFLAMGRDQANGSIAISPLTGELSVHWDVSSNLPLYDAQEQLASDVARALGGTVGYDPLWRLLHVPVTVHNLGGCAMGDDAAHGVTDGTGQVYNYPGLYVLDGGVLPAATGVNPSHTITAVAERAIEQIIRGWTGDARWQAPEKAAALPIVDPVSQLKIPKGGVMPTTTPPISLSLTENMKGFLMKSYADASDFAGAEKAAQDAGATAEYTIEINFTNLDQFLNAETHPGVTNGTIRVTGFTGPDGAPTRNGVFNLFVPTGNASERRMLYLLPFTGADGKPYVLDGFKDVKDHGWFDVWGATSTLYTVIREGSTRDGNVVATGIVKIHLPDFMKQMTTFRVHGTDDAGQKASAMARFGKMFLGTLWSVFVAQNPNLAL